MSGCLNVTLLVFLRLVTIQSPLSRRQMNANLLKMAILTIWILSFLANITPVMVFYYGSETAYFYTRLSVLHCFGVLPVICMAIMYILLLWTLRTKQNIKHSTETPSRALPESLNRKINLLVQRVVGFLVVGYVPYLATEHYYYAVIVNRPNSEVLDAEVMVNKN